MAKPDLGNKHQCLNCGTKFFDLNKNPIVCPKCGTTFQLATAAPPPRATRAVPAAKDDDDENETEGEAEVVSLEDADQVEDGKVEAAATEDDETEDEDTSNDDDDDTFLEDEEDDDGDVAGLIDGDIENDEER